MQIILLKISYIIYLLTTYSFVLYVVLKEKPKHKIVNFIVLAWFATYNSYRSKYAWELFPYVQRLRNFDRQLGVLLFGFMLLSYFSRKKSIRSLPKLVYEKYLYYYLIFAIILFYVHNWLGDITKVRTKSFVSVYISALILFIVMRKFITKEFLRSFVQVIIFVGIATSIVAIIQFFIEINFIRLGPFNNITPGYYRPSGVFRNPGDHSLFLIMAVFTSAYYIKDYKLKYLLVSLFSFNIFLTFGRGIWLAFIFVVVFHFYNFYREKYKKGLILFSTLFGLIAIAAFPILLASGAFNNRFFTDRILADSITPRLGYYRYVISAIPDRLLIGYGDVQTNESYFNAMVALNNGLNWSLGKQGGIHNLILEELYIRGVLSTIFFLMYFYTFFKYTAKQSLKTKNYIILIPGYYVLAYFIYEFSVSGFLLSSSGFLTIFLVTIITAIYHNKIDISEFDIVEKELSKAKNHEMKNKLSE